MHLLLQNVQINFVRFLDWIEYWHNRVADHDFMWMPFQKHRPDEESMIEVGRILKMTPLFATYYNIAVLLRKLLFGNSLTFEDVLMGQVLWMVFFFLWFYLITGQLWNRRAKRLAWQQRQVA